MNAARIACLGLLSLAVLSCSSIAPLKVNTGDQCFRCRRSIINERMATETIDSNRFVSKFRGPGCMAKYLAAHPDQSPTVFVTDYTTGKMIAPQRAFYVPELVDRNTGETEYRAYRLQEHADAFAAETHATPLTWDAVFEHAR